MNDLYYLADTLDMPLRSVGKDMIAEGPKSVRLGPWEAELDLFFESDCLHPTDSNSGFVRFTKNLWAYIVSFNTQTTLYLLDGKAAGLGGTKPPSFSGISPNITLRGLQNSKAIKAKYKYSGSGWKKVNADNLE